MRYRKIIVFYGLAVLVGGLTGLLGALFQSSIHQVTAGTQYLLGYLVSMGIPGALVSSLITFVLVLLAWVLVRVISPDASGSGIPEIEAALLHQKPTQWRRLLPVKFFGGISAIGAGLVMGREGPTIQIGGNLGKMLGEYCRLSPKRCDALIAAGAAAGLATAFNAPLAGVLFVMEEMRRAFPLPFLHFKTVAISCVASDIVLHFLLGDNPAILMPVLHAPPLRALGLFFILGLFMGGVGIGFNRLLMRSLTWMDKRNRRFHFNYMVCIALLVGYLVYVWPAVVGGGYELIEQSLRFTPGVGMIALLFLVRFILTLLCYNVGVPGGIFAPLLALGTLLGLGLASVFQGIFSSDWINPGMFAVAGMGALFSATVRAPITGIVLIVEMTQNYALILPLMVSCLTATTVVQLAGVAPIYTQLLRRVLKP